MTPQTAPSTLSAKMDRLRGQLRRALRWEVCAWTCVWSLGIPLIVGVLDWLIVLPPGCRAVALSGWLTVVVWLGWQCIRRQPAAWDDDLRLARRIEARRPRWREQLITAVQISSEPDHSLRMGSPALRQALLQRTNAEIGRVILDDLANLRRLRATIGFAFLSVAFAAIALLAKHEYAVAAIARLGHPYGTHSWTALEDQSQRFTVPGRPFAIRAIVHGVRPHHALLRYWEHETEHRAHVAVEYDEAADIAAVSVTLPISGPFRFRLQVHDAQIERTVTVGAPPALLADSPEVELRYPAYTGLPPRIQRGAGSIEAVLGTQCEIRGRVDRPIVKAWLEVMPLSERSYPQVNATVGAQGTSFAILVDTAAFPAGNLSYILHWEDADRLSGTVTSDLRLFPDPEPRIALSGAEDGNPIYLLEDATLPIRIAAADPLYGLQAIYLFAHREDDELKPASRAARLAAELLFARAGALTAVPGNPLHDLLGNMHAPGVLFWPAQGPRWEMAVPCSPRQLGWMDGETWQLIGLARDNHPGRPGEAWSRPIQVHVVSEANLQRLLIDAQDRMAAHLTGVRRELESLREGLHSGGEPMAAGSKTQDTLLRLQTLIRRMATTGDSPWARDLRHVQTLLRNNQWERPSMNRSLLRVENQMDEVRDRYLRPLANSLQEMESKPNRNHSTDPSTQLQEAIRVLDQALLEFRRGSDLKRVRADLESAWDDLNRLHNATGEWEERHRGLTQAELSNAAQDQLGGLIERQQMLGNAMRSLLEKRDRFLESPKSSIASGDLWTSLRKAEEELRKPRGLAAIAAQNDALHGLENVIDDWESWQHAEGRRLVQQEQALGQRLRRLAEELMPHAFETSALADQLSAVGYNESARALRRAGGADAQAAWLSFERQFSEREQQIALERLDHQLRRLRAWKRQYDKLMDSVRRVQESSVRQTRWSRATAAEMVTLSEQAHQLIPKWRRISRDSEDLLFLATAYADVDSLLEQAGKAMDRLNRQAVEPNGELPIDSAGRHPSLDAPARRLEEIISALETLRRNTLLGWPSSRAGLAGSPPAPDKGDGTIGSADKAGPGGKSDASGLDRVPWSQLPPRLRQELQEYAKDRPLPEYEEEHRRYMRDVAGQK